MSKQNGRQLNAVKHGAFARDVVLPGESREDFEDLYRSLLDDFAAEGKFEEETVREIAKLLSAKRRLERWNRDKVDELRVKREIAPLKEVAYFDLNPLLAPYPPPSQETLDYAISRCPEPYFSLIRKELRTKLESKISLEEYVETAKRCAADLLPRFRKGLEAEPKSTDYQQPLLSEIENIQAEYINATERLNAIIDRLFKRMLHVKAYKEVLAAQRGAQKTIEAVPNERKAKN